MRPENGMNGTGAENPRRREYALPRRGGFLSISA